MPTVFASEKESEPTSDLGNIRINVKKREKTRER